MATAYELQAANEAQFGEDPREVVARKRIQGLVAPFQQMQSQYRPLGIEDNSNLVQFGVGDRGAAGMMADSVAIPELRKGMFGRAFGTIKTGVLDAVSGGMYSQVQAKKNQLIGDFQKQVEDMMKPKKQQQTSPLDYYNNPNTI